MRAQSAYPALTAFLEHSTEDYHLELPNEEIRSALLEWYEQNRRRLPWRGDPPPYNGSTAGINSATGRAAAAQAAAAPPASAAPPAAPVSAYGVWVSEIMCQQTRVEAVIPFWIAWMEVFPTVEALAAASEEEVNAKWAGLGFYRRARMLHEGAKQVVGECGGVVPTAVDELLKIKGIGPYTAGAVASISAGVAAPIVDGNVLRVLSRLCAISASAKEPAFCGDGKLAWKLAQQLVEAGGGARAGDFNQALMECGATLCAPGGSGTDARDPLRPFYRSTQIGRDAHRAHRAGELEGLLDAAAAAAADGRGVHSRAVCKQGAAEFIDGLRKAAAAESEEEAAAAVHALLPLAPRKKARRLAAPPRRHRAAAPPPRHVANVTSCTTSSSTSSSTSSTSATTTSTSSPPLHHRQARREERLALLALHRPTATTGAAAAAEGEAAARRQTSAGQGSQWLLVKRPAGGLLAGQWEFPAVVVAQHPEELPDDPGAKAPPRPTSLSLPPPPPPTPPARAEAPSPRCSAPRTPPPSPPPSRRRDLRRHLAAAHSQVRREAADELLRAAGLGEAAAGAARRGLGSPVEHIFSHVRHTMHVEHAAMVPGAALPPPRAMPIAPPSRQTHGLPSPRLRLRRVSVPRRARAGRGGGRAV